MNIVYGVCGLGNGHAVRAIPIMEQLIAAGHNIVILSSGLTYKRLKERFPLLVHHHVFTPYLPGKEDGSALDFQEAQYRLCSDELQYNMHVLQKLGEHTAVDLVLSDYEPIAAQYAYIHDIPLITIDQQSKFLFGSWDIINGLSCAAEQQRLRMFFPQTKKRIVCSWFQLEHQGSILNGTIRDRTLGDDEHGILVYISPQAPQQQQKLIAEHIIQLCKKTDHRFTLLGHIKSQHPQLVQMDFQDDISAFLPHSKAMISTAGHTLISEALSYGLPLCLLPRSLYEQQLSASIVQDHGFGIVGFETINLWLDNLPRYRDRILLDERGVLLHADEDRLLKMITE